MSHPLRRIVSGSTKPCFKQGFFVSARVAGQVELQKVELQKVELQKVEL